MKTSVALVSLLAVASTAATTKSAVAATPDESIKEGLKQAICLQDWNQAVELSSNLIASSAITPEYRQTLVDWRHRFSDYARDKTSFDKIPDCEGVQPRPGDVKVQGYRDSGPRFSNKETVASAPNGYYCYQVHNSGYVENLQHMCSGQFVPPVPPPPPVVLSNGNLECSFLGSVTSRSSGGTGESISVPAVCVALTTTSGKSVRVQLKAGNRVLDTHTEVVSYIEAGESYAYDAVFSTDYAAARNEALTPRFIP